MEASPTNRCAWGTSSEAEGWLCLIQSIDDSNSNAEIALDQAIEVAEKRLGKLQYAALKDDACQELYKAWEQKRSEVWLLRCEKQTEVGDLTLKERSAERDSAKVQFLRAVSQRVPLYCFWYGTLIRLQACRYVHHLKGGYPALKSGPVIN